MGTAFTTSSRVLKYCRWRYFLFLGVFLFPGLSRVFAGSATHFQFVSPSSPAGSYTVLVPSNSATFVVQAQDSSNNVDPTFTNHVVNVGLYNTINPPLKSSDTNAIFVESNGTTVIGASVPVTFTAGVASFGVTFQAGSDSEQLYLQDTGGSPITAGDTYPGVFAATIGGSAITVRGFMSNPYFPIDGDFNYTVDNPPADTTPVSYFYPGGPTDPILTNSNVVTLWGEDYGDLIPAASGAIGSSGIPASAACYVIQGVNGGYAAGGAGVTVQLKFRTATGTAPVTYQVILDYDGSVTDFNNPDPTATVWQGTAGPVASYQNFTVISPVAGFNSFQPFMNSGKIILRVWSDGSEPVTMRYAETNGPFSNLSYIQVPYSPANVQPLRSTITSPSYTATPSTPPLVLSNHAVTLVDTFENQFNSPLTQVVYEIPPNSLGGTDWAFTTLNPSRSGCSGSISNPTGTTTAGAITVNFSTPMALNETVGITMIGSTSSETATWPMSILSILTNTGNLGAGDSTQAIVTTLGIPNSPSTLTGSVTQFINAGGDAVSLNWGSPVTNQQANGYVVSRRSPTGSGSFIPVTTITSASITGFQDNGVTNLGSYDYTVVATNPIVQSPPVTLLNVVPYINPATITTLTALTGGTTIELNWSAAVSAPGSYPVAGYQIWRDIQPSMATAVSLTSVGNVGTYNDTSVSGGTQYYYELATVDNQYAGAVTDGPHNSGLSSAQGNGFPLGNAPGISSPSLTSSVPATLTVSWTAPVNNLNPIANYVLFKEAASGGFSAFATLGSAAFSVADGLVTIGTVYSYYVEAVDNQGVTSNPSATVVGQVGPQSPVWSATSASATGITLIWTANPTNQNVISYNVYANGGAIPIGASSTPLLYSGPVTYIDLTPLQGTNYVYTLAGVNNSSVTGALSLPVTSALLPLTPNSFAATVQQTGVSFNVDLTWTAPISGANVTVYDFWNNAVNKNFGLSTFLRQVPLAPQPFVNSQALASAGTTIYYWVSAVDPGGRGPTSIVGLQLPPNPPGSLTVSPSATAVTIGWAARPLSEKVSLYSVYRSTNPTSGFVTIGTTALTSYSDPTAAAGTDYYYEVSATNPGGGVGVPGGESLLSAAVTGALLPPIPTGLTEALNPASDNVTLSWTSQAGSEANLQSYTLTRTINGSAPAILQTASGSVTGYVDSAITPANAGATVLYYLIATNNAGGSSAPEGPVGLQVPPNPPATPAPNASSNSITLNWTPNSPGQNVSQYTVFRNSGSGFVSIGSTPGPPFIDNGSVNGPLVNGSTYTYELTATNPGSGATILGGTSAPSAASAPWGLAPATPAGLGVSLVDNLNDAALTWSSITDPSVTAVYALAATINNLASAQSVTLANTAVSQYYPAQTGDTTYYYWLQAVNPYGASTPEGPIAQLTYPAAVNFLPVTLSPNQSTVLSWTPLGTDVTSYVESREISGSNNFTQSQTITAAGLVMPVTLALPFTPDELYDYQITAINATGTGPGSALQAISYLPSAPVSVTAVSGTSNLGVTVSLSWSDPVSASEGVTAFTVYKATTLTGTYSAAASGLTSPAYLDGAVTGTGVYYYILAADDHLGKESAVTYTNAVAVTAFALPNAPAAFTAASSNASVTLTWTPAVVTTYPVSIYQIQKVSGGVTILLTAANGPYGDTAVTNGVTYVYTVQTEDSQGNLSPAAGPVTGLPLASPGPPQNVNAGTGDSELLLTWKAGTPGTLPIGSYLIYRSTGGPYALLATVPAAATGYLDPTLTDTDSYSYYMVSVDSSGVTTGLDASSNSATVTGTPVAGAVNPAGAIAAAAGVSQVVLTWTDSVTVTGPAAVTGYSIYQEINSGSFVSIGSVAAGGTASQSVTESNLLNGDLYTYYLVGDSATSTSASSATVFGTPAGPPVAPTPVIGIDGSNKVTLDWGASPAQGAVTILKYYVVQSINSSFPVTFNTAGPVTTYVDNSVNNTGETVVYQVGAINSNNTAGAPSGPVTDYPYAPFAPTINSHSAGTTTVTLNFTQGGSLTWSPLAQLQILRTPAGGGSAVTLATATTTSPYTDITASTGTLYIYSIEEVDSKGHVSALSNPVTEGPSNPPAAPANFIVTPGSQQVLLDWPASAPVSGAIPVSFYIVTVNGSPTTVYAPLTWDLVNTISGLPLSDPAAVTVTLQAVDDSGVTVGNHASTVVGPVTVTTSQSDLNPPTGLTATVKPGNSVLINWTRPNDDGRVITAFNIYRSGGFITAVGSPLATVNNPALAPVTAYVDNSAGPGSTYYYVVRAVYSQSATLALSPNSNNATASTPGLATPTQSVPLGVMAFDANLLKPLTGQKLGIYFMAPDSGPAEIDIYNISGHPIRALYATAQAGAQVSLTWDGKDRNGSWAASGIYLIELKAPGLHQIKKVLVVK
jgi:fibronectin type 3 domain-containing protein